MKRLLIICCLFVLSWYSTNAQTSGAVVTTSPSSFTADDVVKIIVDVSNVPNLRGKDPLYVWTWHPGDPPITDGNGSWNSSNEAMKMVKEGTDRWSWTITPTNFYKKEINEIKELKFLIKAKDGSGDAKSDDIIIKVSPKVFVPNVFRVFPKFVSPDDAVTIYLDQKLATDINTERMVPVSAKIAILDQSNSIIDSEKTVTLTSMGDKLYLYMFFPTKLVNVPAGRRPTSFRVIFVGTMKDASGATMHVDSPAFTQGFDDLTN